MKKLISRLLLLSSVIGSVSFAGGTVTEAVSKTRGINQVTLSFVTSTNGEATATTAAYGGYLRRAVLTITTNTPTTLFDVTLLDAHGSDLLFGLGANISTAVVTTIAPLDISTYRTTNATLGLAFPFDGPLSLAITNAGSGKSGSIVLYIQ